MRLVILWWLGTLAEFTIGYSLLISFNPGFMSLLKIFKVTLSPFTWLVGFSNSGYSSKLVSMLWSSRLAMSSSILSSSISNFLDINRALLLAGFIFRFGGDLVLGCFEFGVDMNSDDFDSWLSSSTRPSLGSASLISWITEEADCFLVLGFFLSWFPFLDLSFDEMELCDEKVSSSCLPTSCYSMIGVDFFLNMDSPARSRFESFFDLGLLRLYYIMARSPSSSGFISPVIIRLWSRFGFLATGVLSD